MVDEEKLREMQKLNIELMDTLVAASIVFLDYCKTHNIQFSGLDGLATLISRAGRICEEIGAPYNRNPVLEKFDSKTKKRGCLFVVLLLLTLTIPHYPSQIRTNHGSSPNDLPHLYQPNKDDALPYYW